MQEYYNNNIITILNERVSQFALTYKTVSDKTEKHSHLRAMFNSVWNNTDSVRRRTTSHFQHHRLSTTSYGTDHL